VFRRVALGVLARLADFEVIGEADTGEASIEAARVLRPNLVLVDIHLPGIDGPEATRRILAEPPGKDRPPVVFLLSTYEAVDCAAQTIACGAAIYLSKAEFSPATLRTAWATVCADGQA